MHGGVNSLAVVPLFAAQLCLFLLPGLWVAALLRRPRLPPALLPGLVIVVSSLLGYATFWVYLASPVAGRAASAALLAVSVGALLLRPTRAALLGVVRQEDVHGPFVVMAAVGLAYLAVLYGVELDDVPERAALQRFPGMHVTIDNLLPMWFADRLYAGEDPRHLFGSWRSSDRPPLQTGLVLVQQPLASLIGVSSGLAYQTLATILQLTWVPAAWALARRAGLERRRLALVMAFPILSGFALFNTVFVWPKMLAAALALVSVGLLLPRDDPGERLPTGRVVLAGVAGALALLAHGGAAFTLAAAGLFLLRPCHFPGLRGTVAAAAAFIALLIPWYAYGCFYDPPANRLVKWHIAGVIDVDERSAGQAIADSYAAVGWRGALANRVANAATLVGPPLTDRIPAGGVGPGQPVLLWRNQEYWHLVPALGLLNVGWVVLLASFLRRGRGPEPPFLAVSRTYLVLALLSLLIWVLVIFGPGATVVLHGSYATMLLLFLGLAMQIVRLPLGWALLILTAQLIDFLACWVEPRPPGAGGNLMLLGSVGVAVVGLLFGSAWLAGGRLRKAN